MSSTLFKEKSIDNTLPEEIKDTAPLKLKPVPHNKLTHDARSPQPSKKKLGTASPSKSSLEASPNNKGRQVQPAKD
jgi:hypothetical protein